MLHELLLSLSGHPSPLLRTATATATATTATATAAHGGTTVGTAAPPDPASTDTALITPPERELLAGIAHLSDLHVKLLSFTAQIAAAHPSAICRAVATGIEGTHLAAFQRKVLAVEDGILRRDAGLVGAYNIVPLAAVVVEFGGWTRRMEWLWGMVEFMLERKRRRKRKRTVSKSNTGSRSRSRSMSRKSRDSGDDGEETADLCTGASVINRLRAELQTGYQDIEETARSLVRVAETAWVKQVSSWILYGRLPGFGAEDFFIQKVDDDEDFVCDSSLLPSFVTAPTSASMLFIGRSLNHIRTKSSLDGGMQGLDHLSSQLRALSQLTYPLDSGTFSRTITGIRLFLSRNTLQKLLPLSRVLEMLQLLRDFFLLGRGEFAMALTQQADEKIRSRWRRADNLAHEKRDGLSQVTVKEGEVMAVLTRTWAAMGSMQGQQADEDEGLEMARDLLRLTLVTSPPKTPLRLGSTVQIAATPFRNLMFSVPVTLTLRVPSPLDLFLNASDVQTYTAINSYLHSLRRAHLRLTDLWKISPLRRHHPAPPQPGKRGRAARVTTLRERQATRMLAMRSAWTTCSAAIFFLAEVEGYLQIEVVRELWEGFQRWLTTGSDEHRPPAAESARPSRAASRMSTADADVVMMDEDVEDVWLAEGARLSPLRGPGPGQADRHHPHDPQTLAAAHALYLSTLVRRILLSQESFTDPLYGFLLEIDQLVALIHRLQEIWNSIDLEDDLGVVDAFVDLQREERDVERQIRDTVGKTKSGIEGVIAVLRSVEADREGLAWGDDDAGEDGSVGIREEGQYVPRRVGGLDRLLMKLDFGSWFDTGRSERMGATGSYEQ